MEITIEPYSKQYEEQLKRLLQDADGDLSEKFISGQTEHVFVAVRQSRLVGALLTWKNKFHPYCTYFRTIIRPSFPERTIVVQLLEKVEAVRVKGLPLVTSFWEESESVVRLYLQNGFDIVRKTYMPTLKVADHMNVFFQPKEKYKLSTVAEIYRNDLLVEELLRLVKRNYERSHEVNPVAKLSLNQWRELTFSDDLIRKGSFLYLKENRIIAYAFLHESNEINMLDLGWVGALEPAYKGEIVSLVYQQLEFARERGVEFISGEFDTTDEYAFAVWESIPFAPTQAWLTLKRM